MKFHTYKVIYKDGRYSYESAMSEQEAIILAQAKEIEAARDWRNVLYAEVHKLNENREM